MADVFISYRRQDGAQLAYLIKERLEDRGFHAFLDVTGLAATGPFPQQLGQAIAEARVFVCLLGANTLESEWVQKEIEQAQNLGLTLIPVFQPGFHEPECPQPESVRLLLRNQGVTIPEDTQFLGTALENLVALVKDALQHRRPARRFLWGTMLGLIIGLAIGLGVPWVRDRVASTEDRPPAPLSAHWNTNISDGDRVGQITTFIAEYTGDLAGDLWIFVVPPNGRVYPQSENACRGEGTEKRNGKWEMRIVLGGTDSVDKPFDIVLAVAPTPEDSEFIAYTLMAWCNAGNYPGFEEMPKEVTEVYRVAGVVRTAEVWGEAPTLATAQLDGRVTIAGPVEGDTVGASTAVSGTYVDTDSDIWVLVSPSHGRWYPQSESPCEAVHALKDEGQWQAPKVTFGDEVGQPFDIVVVVADEEASAFFDRKLKLWCRAGYYPGLRTIELPAGIEEKDRVRVYRE